MTTTTKTANARRELFATKKLRLTGTNGNAFSILAKASEVLRKAKASEEEIADFTAEATSGDYGYLLFVCQMWFDVR